MGRKRTRAGKHLSFFLACCIISYVGIYGCSSVLGKFQHQNGPTKTRGVLGNSGGPLVKAKVLFDHGEYQASLQEAERVLKTHFRTSGDEALFLMGLIYGHPNNPNKDWKESLKRFQRLKEAFPTSRMNEQAELFVLLVTQIAEQDETINELKKKKAQLLKTVEAEKAREKAFEKENERLQSETASLRDQLEKLKEIDLVIEEKKNQAK